jgi:hypothetical protein
MALGEIPGGNLRAYYKLENVNDSSGNAFTLTNNNSVAFNSGRFTNSADFGSTGTNKGLTSTTNILSATSVTNIGVMFWFKLNSTANITDRFIFNLNSKTSATDGLSIACYYSITGGTQLNLTARRSFQASGNSDASQNIPVDTEWHLIQIVKDDKIIGISVDGKRMTTATNVNNDRSITTNQTIYASIGNNRGLTVQVLAQVDEFIVDEGIYSLASTQPNNRIKYYTQAKGRFCI